MRTLSSLKFIFNERSIFRHSAFVSCYQVCKHEDHHTHNLSTNGSMGGGWRIKKGGCCWTIEPAVCPNSSGQLRVSATRAPKPPPSVPLSHYPYRPASNQQLTEESVCVCAVGSGGRDRPLQAFVPFIESGANLLTNSGAVQWHLA